MDLVDFSKGYFHRFHECSVEDLHSRVEKWVTEENVNLFEPTPLEVVTLRLCDLSIDPDELRKLMDVASYLTAKKAKFRDIRSTMGRQVCLIEAALILGENVFDAQIIGSRLLEMLDASHVDLAEYLAAERQHHLEGSLAPDIAMLKRKAEAIELRICEQQPFSLSWDWWVDPKGLAFEALHEFRHFGLGQHDLWGNYWRPEEMMNWPFIYPGRTAPIQKLPGRYVGKAEAVLQHFQQRSDHRWRKKMIKQARINGTYKKSKMPGAWIH
jgi:hypothetical protein